MKFIPYSSTYKEQVFPSLVPVRYFAKYTANTAYYKIFFWSGFFRNYLYILLDLQGQVIGCIAMRRKPNFSKLSFEWFIYGVGIKREFRGKGYGLMIMKEALFWLKSNSVKNIKLFVDKNNYIAINLYLKTGFRVASKDQVESMKICVPKNELLMFAEI